MTMKDMLSTTSIGDDTKNHESQFRKRGLFAAALMLGVMGILAVSGAGRSKDVASDTPRNVEALFDRRLPFLKDDSSESEESPTTEPEEDDTCPADESACNSDGWVCPLLTRTREGSDRRLGGDSVEPAEVCGVTPMRERHLETMYALVTPNGDQRNLVESMFDIMLSCPSKGIETPITCEECCVTTDDEKRRRELGLELEPPLITTPWMSPKEVDGASLNLLEADPGIWTIHGFIEDDLLDRLSKALFRAGDHMGQFGPCAGESHAHLQDKECFGLSPSTSHPDDQAVIQQVMAKLASIWPSNNEQRDYMYAQRTKPGCGPTNVHKDKNHNSMTSATVTTVLYLSDGGAGVFFPHTGTIVTPERGMLATWINVHPDGEHNYKANHGIQASPEGAQDRLALSFRINFSEEELSLAQADRS